MLSKKGESEQKGKWKQMLQSTQLTHVITNNDYTNQVSSYKQFAVPPWMRNRSTTWHWQPSRTYLIFLTYHYIELFLCHSRIIKMRKSLNCFFLYGRTLCYILADHNYHIFLFFSLGCEAFWNCIIGQRGPGWCQVPASHLTEQTHKPPHYSNHLIWTESKPTTWASLVQ